MPLKDNARAALGGAVHGQLGEGTAAGAWVSARQSTSDPVGCQTRVPLLAADGKVCGVIVNGVLTKAVDGTRHFLKSPPAIALDAGAVAQAEAAGVEQIAVTDRETGKIYRATLSEFHRYGWRFNRGYGEQVAMRVARWHTGGEPTVPTVAAAPAPAQPAVVQLALL
jgi:hypothetical protein